MRRYVTGQEEYYTETKAKDLDYKSPISGKEMVRSSEENYYFKLSVGRYNLKPVDQPTTHSLKVPGFNH